MARDKFWWFPEASSVALAERISAAGPGHRLEVRIDKDNKMTFRVVPSALMQSQATAAGTPTPPDINDSWMCPPICPGK